MRFALALAVLSIGFFSLAAGQEKAPSNADTPAVAADTQTPPTAADFPAIFAQWKQLLGRLREIQAEFQVAKPEQRPDLQKQFNEKVAEGEKLAPRLVKAAEASYQANPNQDQDVARFLAAVAVSDQRTDRYENAARLGKLLLSNNFQSQGLNDSVGISCFEVADFDAAEKYFKAAETEGTLSEQGKAYLEQIDEYRGYWKREQELRAAEAKADDLPRVLLATSKGDITLELFENEAPNTVANFISLVEKGSYNNNNFHRVLAGFMAQGGCPKGDGTGGPGYNIPCECYEEDHRIHFRGSLSMAHAGKDTGGSQFFLTFRPTSHLNGKHTVFGRVIDGMDVLNELQRRDPNDPNAPAPDKIIEAKVLRKRDHEYKPTTLP